MRCQRHNERDDLDTHLPVGTRDHQSHPKQHERLYLRLQPWDCGGWGGEDGRGKAVGTKPSAR